MLEVSKISSTEFHSGCSQHYLTPDLPPKQSPTPYSVLDVLKAYKPKVEASIRKWLPRSFDQESLVNLLGPARYSYDVDSCNKAIAEPIWEMLDRGGKRWRPTLMLLVAEAIGATSEQMEIIYDLTALCELIHTGSLIIDDIEDNSELRRGQPCLHKQYPLDVSINVGNALYFLPLSVLKTLRGKLPDDILVRCYEIYGSGCVTLHVGQGLDIWWHNGNKDPSAEEYLQMCAYKTGTLAGLACKIAALVGGASETDADAMQTFAESVGVAFQIQDDLLNIVGEKFTTSVTGEDITEAKRSLMVIHCLHHGRQEDSKLLREILDEHTKDRNRIDLAINILQRNGSIEYARSRAKAIIKEAWTELENATCIHNMEAREKLRAFADFLIEREI